MKGLLHRKLTEKGFTLAELLIVVAILAILVAVSIPIFTTKLADAKKATDEANLRACKALVVNSIMTDDFPSESWNKIDIFGDVTYSSCFDAKNGCLVKTYDGSGYGQGSNISGTTNCPEAEGESDTWKTEYIRLANDYKALNNSIIIVTVKPEEEVYLLYWIPTT